MSFSTSSGQVHEWWERYHSDQANISQLHPSMNACVNKYFVGTTRQLQLLVQRNIISAIFKSTSRWKATLLEFVTAYGK
jgi:hypothetical protein